MSTEEETTRATEDANLDAFLATRTAPSSDEYVGPPPELIEDDPDTTECWRCGQWVRIETLSGNGVCTDCARELNRT